MKNQCKDCAYFHSHRNLGKTGKCHYGPPTANLNPHGWSMYPRTKGDSWCGKWEPREDLIDSSLVDTAHEMLAGKLSVEDFSDSLGNLIIAISRINQFMKRNPNVEIQIQRYKAVSGEAHYLEAKIQYKNQLDRYYVRSVCAYSLELLILRLDGVLERAEKVLREDWGFEDAT